MLTLDNADLLEKLKKMEQSGKLYKDLINRTKPILKIRIIAPKVETPAAYDKYVAWSNYWKQYKNHPSYELVMCNKRLGDFFPGIKQVPYQLILKDIDEAFMLLGKGWKKQLFLKAFAKVILSYPTLSDWCVKYREELINKEKFAESIISIARYILNNPKRNCYLTEWEIPNVDTKFIKRNFTACKEMANVLLNISLKNKEDFCAYFGILERNAKITIGFPDRTTPSAEPMYKDWPIEEITKWDIHPKKALIMENKDCGSSLFITLPNNLPVVIISGAGNAIAALRNVPWLRNTETYYWGDFDRAGYQILNTVRSFKPDCKSIFMDNSTFERFEKIADPHQDPDKEIHMPYLTNEERNCLENLIIKGKQLEQEKILNAVRNEIIKLLQE